MYLVLEIETTNRPQFQKTLEWTIGSNDCVVEWFEPIIILYWSNILVIRYIIFFCEPHTTFHNIFRGGYDTRPSTDRLCSKQWYTQEWSINRHVCMTVVITSIIPIRDLGLTPTSAKIWRKKFFLSIAVSKIRKWDLRVTSKLRLKSLWCVS